MQKELQAIILGATGLVGSHLLQQLLDDKRYSKVKVFHRRSTGVEDPKLEEHVIDFDQAQDWATDIRGDHLFLCLGTTLKTAGSEEAQYKVDFSYQWEAARAAHQNGVSACALVSSAGASADSKGFYLRMKGELDEAVRGLGFPQLAIMRPSILDGNRGESRPAEQIGLFFMRLIRWIPGIRKYRPIHAKTVAGAMIQALNKDANSCSIYEWDEIFELAAG